MTTQATINGITYNVLAELELDGKAAENGFYTSLVMLQRPNGHKKFEAMRDITGAITLN
jgi:hypothetical protein